MNPSFMNLIHFMFSLLLEKSFIHLQRNTIMIMISFQSQKAKIYLFSKVEFALKLGYAEELTRRALDKIGFSACNVSDPLSFDIRFSNCLSFRMIFSMNSSASSSPRLSTPRICC